MGEGGLTLNRARLLRLSEGAARFATPVRALLDVVAWGLAASLAVYLRFDLSFPADEVDGFRRALPLVAALQLLGGYAIGLYRRRWRYGSHDEIAALLGTAIITTGGLFGLNEFYFADHPIPQSVVLVGGVFGLSLMFGVRYVWRVLLERLRRPTHSGVEKILVYGAGEGGLQVITALLRNPASQYLPVGLIDDDPSKRRLSIMGVSVMGDRRQIVRAANRTGASALLIAIPSADSHLVGELADLSSAASLQVKILPVVDDLISGRVTIGDIRDLDASDLMGRHQVETNIDEIARYLTGRRVLVTGAGGSIGSELCEQIYRFAPSELLMLDRDESALHQVQLSIHGRALLESSDTILADIRDAATVEQIFLDRRPDVVFHAAALKHLPLLEMYPQEGHKTNVIGSLNVLRAAEVSGVSVFVNVSTDKAANPSSVLGYTKRAAERLTAHFAAEAATGDFLSVRFGNVLGSRGSVLGSFQEQIKAGGPVTVTHREVTRYFMTVSEAVQLVIQAGAIGRSGEVLVLDMGEPVRIFDIARRLVAQSGKEICIEITGLRPGEKLHEELFGDGEIDQRPLHPLVSHAPVPPLDPETLEEPRDVNDMAQWR